MIENKKLKKIALEINAIIEKRQKELKLSFVEDTHTYTMRDSDGILRSDWLSVSKVLEFFYTKFDAESKSYQMTNGDLEEQRLLLEQWAMAGKVASEMGSRTHFELETYINNLYKRDKDIRKPIFECAEREILRSDAMIISGKKFIDSMHKRGAYLVDTEMVLGSDRLNYTGQPDKLWLIENKGKPGLILTDWKTNKPENFLVKPYHRKMEYPFDYLYDTALGHYNLQLPFYGKLIKDMLRGSEHENIPIYGYIIVLLLDNGNFEEYRVDKETYTKVLDLNMKNYIK